MEHNADRGAERFRRGEQSAGREPERFRRAEQSADRGADRGSERLRLWKERAALLALAGLLLLLVLPSGSGVLPWAKAGAQEAGNGETAEAGRAAGNSGAAETEGTAQDLLEAGLDEDAGQEAAGLTGSERYARALEERLARILSRMEGAGQVQVMITLEDTGERIVEKDTPERTGSVREEDSEGGSRVSGEEEREETTVYTAGENGGQEPFVARRRQPEIAGVLVAAQGGADGRTAADITEAVQALFGLEAHKIKVVKMTTGE